MLSSDFSVDSALSAVRYLEMYEELVDLFANVFSEIEKNPGADIASEGMKNFRELVYSVAKSEEYLNLKRGNGSHRQKFWLSEKCNHWN